MLRTVILGVVLLCSTVALSDESAPTPCTTNDDCAATEFCNTESAGQCNAGGECTPRGINVMCVTTCDPVCGCDGKTYLNLCYAHKGGTSVAQRGVCP